MDHHHQNDDEVVRIDISEFLKITGCERHKEHVIDLTSKLSTLLAQFAVMVAESVAHDVPFVSRYDNGHGHENGNMQYGGGFGGYGYRRRGGGGSNTNSSWKTTYVPQQRTKILVNKNFDSSFARMLISCLNKLTEQNFARLLPEIEKSFRDGEDDTNKLCELILIKCCHDHGYIPLYTRLLSNITKCAPVLDEFVDRSLEMYRTESFHQPDIKEYDEFCLSNRKMHHVLGRNMTILNLISLESVSIKRCEYIREVIAALHGAVDGGHIRRAELMLEIVTCMIDTFADTLNSKDIERIKRMISSMNAHRATATNTKIRFKLMHIKDILGMKS